MTKEELEKLDLEIDFVELIDVYENQWAYTNVTLARFGWKHFNNDKTELLTFRDNFIILQNTYLIDKISTILRIPWKDK
jgi:hypothetical protein